MVGDDEETGNREGSGEDSSDKKDPLPSDCGIEDTTQKDTNRLTVDKERSKCILVTELILTRSTGSKKRESMTYPVMAAPENMDRAKLRSAPRG